MTTPSLYLIFFRAALMPIQSMWSLPGVPRSLPQAWKCLMSVPALRIAFGWFFSSMFM